MIENIPLKEIPLPNYEDYKMQICANHNLELPLNRIPKFDNGNLNHIPTPINKAKDGWPWTTESDPMFSLTKNCPKISIVIPSYQQGEFIEETIRSVLLQNYPSIELIIIDGGSNDCTSAVLEHYKNFISFSVIEEDHGQSHAINKGFSIASGELYYWLNSDDYLNRNSLQNVIPHFIHDEKLDIVYGHGLILDNLTNQISFDFAPLVLERYLRFGGIVLSHSVIWRSRIHCKIWEDLNCAMDAELWLRLFHNKLYKHCYFPIGIFRKHPTQKTAKNSGWETKWKSDFENYIWIYYPSLNKITWKFRAFEFKILQRIHRAIFKFKYDMRQYISELSSNG